MKPIRLHRVNLFSLWIDVIDKDKIKYQMDRLLDSSPDTIATCKWTRFYNDDVSTSNFYHHPDYKDFEKPIEWLLMSFSGKGTMPLLSWLMPRKLVEKVGPWDERLSLNDDAEYHTRVVLNSSQIFYCEKSKAYYRSNINGLSSRKDIEALISYFLVCQLCTKHLLEYETSDRINKACANLWQSFVYRCYPYSLDMARKGEMKVHEYGGSDLKLGGRNIIKVLRKLIGWKLTKKIELTYNRLFYNS